MIYSPALLADSALPINHDSDMESEPEDAKSDELDYLEEYDFDENDRFLIPIPIDNDTKLTSEFVDRKSNEYIRFNSPVPDEFDYINEYEFDEDESYLIPTLEEISSPFSALDEPQRYVSSGVNQLSKSIDEFFSNEKVIYETNGSYLRINGDAIYGEGGETVFSGNVKIKIALPNTRRKLKLVIESDPNETREDIDQQQQETPLEAVQEKTYFAGLEGTGKEYRSWKLRPGIGLKLNSGLDLLLRFRASRNYAISEDWRAYLTETIYWYDSEGYRFNSTLQINRKIYDNFLFRANTFAGWREETDYWDLNQIFSLTHTIDHRQQIIYEAGVFGISEPTINATDYLLELRYRKRIHSTYLYAEAIPRILYEKETDFEPIYSFTFRLEIVFKS